jgi:hypothetical protein
VAPKISPENDHAGRHFGVRYRRAILLSTRRQILEKSGYRVFTTMEFADAMMVLLNQRISVLVLCHSLRYDERYGWRLPEHFCRI